MASQELHVSHSFLGISGIEGGLHRLKDRKQNQTSVEVEEEGEKNDLPFLFTFQLLSVHFKVELHNLVNS